MIDQTTDEILESIGFPLCILNRELEIITCNDLFRELFARSFKDNPVFPFEFFPYSSELLHSRFNACFENRTSLHINAIPFQFSQIDTQLSLRIIPYPSGTLSFNQLMVSCQKDEFSPKNKEENLSFDDIDHFFASFAHEIKNPLTVLKGSLQMLARKLKNDSNEYRFTQVSLDEIARIHLLIDNLKTFDFAKNPELTAYNVHQILDESILFLSYGREKGNILKDYDPSVPLVSTHVFLLKQVCLNLFKNAIRACPNGEKIRIKTGYLNEWEVDPALKSNKAKYIFVDFIDEGEGIEESNKSNLFKPFFSTTKDGKGLGLSISRKLMLQMQGYLQVVSLSNPTCFRLSIPVQKF